MSARAKRATKTSSAPKASRPKSSPVLPFREQVEQSVASDSDTSATLSSLSAALLDVLNAPAEFTRFKHRPKKCFCTLCATIRSKTFECDACGYEGAPHIYGCECDLGTCDGIGQPNNSDQCSHGETQCPICAGGGDEYDEQYVDLRGRLKTLRRLIVDGAPQRSTEHLVATDPGRELDRRDDAATGGRVHTLASVQNRATGIEITAWRREEMFVTDTLLTLDLTHSAETGLRRPSLEFVGLAPNGSIVLEVVSNTALPDLADALRECAQQLELRQTVRRGIDDVAPVAANSPSEVVFNGRDGESFRMRLTPEQVKATEPATDWDRAIATRYENFIMRLAGDGPAAAQATKQLAQINADYMRAIAAVQDHGIAWSWYREEHEGKKRFAEGVTPGDMAEGLAELQAQYDEELIDAGFMEPANDNGVFLSDREFNGPGVYPRYDGKAFGFLEIDVVFGSRVYDGAPGEEDATYQPDMYLCVAADRTAQALAMNFALDLFERYAREDLIEPNIIDAIAGQSSSGVDEAGVRAILTKYAEQMRNEGYASATSRMLRLNRDDRPVPIGHEPLLERIR